MSGIDLSQISDMTLIDEINRRDNGLCVWTLQAREEAILVTNAFAGRNPDKLDVVDRAKLDALVEAVRNAIDAESTRCWGSTTISYWVPVLHSALAAFEGRD